MPWPRGKSAHNKGSFWSDESLERALGYVRDGWSLDYALSLAGHTSHTIIKKPYKEHPAYLEMVRINNERNSERVGSFIVRGSKAKASVDEARPSPVPPPDDSLPCGLVQNGGKIHAESHSGEGLADRGEEK